MQIQGLIEAAVAEVGKVLLGKEPQIRLALCCLYRPRPPADRRPARYGQDDAVPRPGGRAGTVLEAGSVYQRPAAGRHPGRVGVRYRNDASFTFHPGPIFTQLLLADEINRTTPRTQSALLEAMAEGQVTVEGETRPLPQPFFVIATQNPIHQSGTYPLPESQLDRFLMRLQLGYPHPHAEREMF